MDNESSLEGVAVVILAAGRGTRLSPLTDHTPKPLCKLGSRPMIDWVIGRLPVARQNIAVNAHHLANQLVDHFSGSGIRVEVEPELLGTAGAIANLRGWIDGRDVLIHNSDAWIEGDFAHLWRGWDRRRPRLLVTPTLAPSDFGCARFVGVSMLPAADVARLNRVPSDLYTEIWKPAFEDGELDLASLTGRAIDCGTWEDYARASSLAEALE